MPMCHRQFFRKRSQSHDYVQTHCNARNNPFHFACRKWYSHKNPQYDIKKYIYTCTSTNNSTNFRILV